MTVLEKNQELLKLTAPVTGRTLKEDGTVVNMADLAADAASGQKTSLNATGGGQSDPVSTSTVSAQSDEIASGDVTVFCTADTYYRAGLNPVAVSDGTDDVLPAYTKLRIDGITSGHKLAFILASGTGTVTVTPAG